MREIEFRAAMILECLGEPIRFQIIRHLAAEGAKSVSELARVMKRHPTTICHHLAVLRGMQIVRYRNHGRFTFYEVKLKTAKTMTQLAIRAARNLNVER